MIGTVAVPSNRLPIAKMERLGTAGATKAGEASRAGSDSRFDIACLSGAMADKAGLETIGLLLVLITLFVIGAGAFAVRHQLAADPSQDWAGYGVYHREGPTARSGCAVGPRMPCNFLR
jgi:hypothetical protein